MSAIAIYCRETSRARKRSSRSRGNPGSSPCRCCGVSIFITSRYASVTGDFTVVKLYDRICVSGREGEDTRACRAETPCDGNGAHPQMWDYSTSTLTGKQLDEPSPDLGLSIPFRRSTFLGLVRARHIA